MTGRIVVGVDGSEHAGRALSFAVEEARRRGAAIEAVLAHDVVVYYPGVELGAVGTPTERQLEERAQQTLEEALADVPDDVTVEPVVTEGPPPRALLERAGDADLLVVGSRGRGGFRGLLLGSTSHQVISHAPCPVVVVPHPRQPEQDPDPAT